MRQGSDSTVSETIDSGRPGAVVAALCVGADALDRFFTTIRHLAVGLVDQAVPLRLLSSDPRIEAMQLGPIQTLHHDRIGWPLANRRLEELVETLSPQPPTLVHALAGESYRVAGVIAEAFDADLVFQVTSQADCDLIARMETTHVGRFVAFSRPLADSLERHSKIFGDRIEMIRPGVLAAAGIGAFAEPGRVPTILSTCSLDRGGGVDLLVEAVAILHERGRNLLAFLLGRGPYEAVLRRAVRARNLSAMITFADPSGDIELAMRSADIFIRTSPDDAFTVDGLQAMGDGMAVISFPCAVSDHYRQGETALVCDGTSAEALAAAIEKLLADESEAKRLAAGGVEYVKVHHAMSTMAERTASLYRELALSHATFPIRE